MSRSTDTATSGAGSPIVSASTTAVHVGAAPHGSPLRFVGLVVIGCTRDPAYRRSPLPDRCGSHVADGTSFPNGRNAAGSDPPGRCAGGTPVGPEKRRFSTGRSRHLVRRNRQPFADAERPIEADRPPVSEPACGDRGVIATVIRQPGCNHTLARRIDRPRSFQTAASRNRAQVRSQP